MNFMDINHFLKNNLEKIAAVQHAIWSHWMRYLFNVCIINEDGSLTIPSEKVLRWTRQMNTDYNDLSEDEKKSDKNQANKVIDVLLQEARGGLL